MSLNGIDISSHQSDIRIENIESLDFVIVKATQGTTYTNPSFTNQVKQTQDCGKLLGAYHYVGGGGAKAEAEFFWSKVKHLKGEAIFAIDWEEYDNGAWQDVNYLKELIQHFITLSGINPLIYAGKATFPWSLANELNCGSWVAQYATTNPTSWQTKPWNESMYSCTIRQYTGVGLVNGYPGYLDLNKAYLTEEQWMAYAGQEKIKEGWKKDNKGWWYVREDGSYPKNQWKQINGEWYYFDGVGYAVTGWQKIGNHWYYLNTKEDGIECAMHKGWLIKNDTAYYLRPKKDGNYPEGSMVEKVATNIKCTFDINGHLVLN